MSETLKYSCSWCKKTISNPKSNKRFCSRICKNQKYGEVKKAHKAVELSTGTSGAIAELLAGADLLQRGFAVFRALSPSSPCDLAILYDGKLLGIEVRTGYRCVEGNQEIRFSKKFQNGADIFAVYCPVEDIFYYEAITFPGQEVINTMPNAWRPSA